MGDWISISCYLGWLIEKAEPNSYQQCTAIGQEKRDTRYNKSSSN